MKIIFKMSLAALMVAFLAGPALAERKQPIGDSARQSETSQGQKSPGTRVPPYSAKEAQSPPPYNVPAGKQKSADKAYKATRDLL